MIKVSDLLGKPLISLADAKSVGYVSNVWFDSKLRTVKTAEITDDDDDVCERKYVPFRFMQCDGDAAVIKSLTAVLNENAATAVLPSPINRFCYNQSGKEMGHVRDVVLDGTQVTQILTEKATFTPKELLSSGNNLCIFNDTGLPVKLPKPQSVAPRMPVPTAKHARMPVQLHNAAPVQTPVTPQNVTVTRTPGEPIKNYGFLLGKPVHSPVVKGGKVLVAAGAVVTDAVIELCRKENKLVQLALRAY